MNDLLVFAEEIQEISFHYKTLNFFFRENLLFLQGLSTEFHSLIHRFSFFKCVNLLHFLLCLCFTNPQVTSKKNLN